MSYVGIWNACCDYEGNHVHRSLREGSVAVKSFMVAASDDAEALERAKEISKRENLQLISLAYLSGMPPKFDRRKIDIHGED